jgi:hypothetical protein
MFLNNKYNKWYTAIVTRAQHRPFTADLEEHHIIPNSFYINCTSNSRIGWLKGNPDDPANLVYLTIREHRLCHLLLVRMTEGPARHKMLRAARLMLNTRAAKYGLSKGKCYEQIKLECAALARAYVPTAETRAELSAANKGRKHSAEWIENNRQAQLCRAPATQDTRDKLRQAMTGRVMSEEWKQKIGAAHKGRTYSEETIERMRQGAKNRPPMSAETKAKISPKGRTHSPETKEKMRLAAIARHASKK